MKNFSEWLEPEKPKGLEGIKQRLSEAYREFGDQATGRPQRRSQPKPQQSAPEPKADEFAGFAGMEPAKLDALRGLAGNQPNPGARAKFIQNALANFQKQQAKPAEEPASEPKAAPAKPKLSLKPDTKLSTKAKATAPEPEDEDKVDPDLERRAMAKIAQIQGGSRPIARALASRDYDAGDRDTMLSRLQSFIEKRGGKRGGGYVKAAQQMLDTLNGPNRNQLLDTLGYSQQYDRGIDENWGELSQINNIDDARKLLEQGWGFERGSNGLYVPGRILPGMRERHSMPLDNKNKGYRGLQYRSLLRLLDPELQEILNSGDIQGMQARSIVNPQLGSSAWGIAGELMKEMDPKLIRTHANLGGPAAMRQALNPKMPVEWLTTDGEATGLTNIDMLQQLEPDLYEAQFDERPDERRAQFQLAKALMTGSQDQMLLQPDFLSGLTGVVDHSEGRSQANTDGIKKESPLKQLMTANDVNWAKADSPDEEGNKDTIPGLVRRAQSFQNGTINPIGRGIDPEDQQQVEMLWLANRLMGADLNREEKKEFVRPSSVEEVANLDADGIKEMVDKNQLNIRNLSMYYPRREHGRYDQNSWSGAMNRKGGGNRGYYGGLDGLRKSLISGALFNPKMQEQMATKRQELERDFKGDEAKVDEGMKKFERQLMALNYQMPLQAGASTWTTGLSDKDQWLSYLGDLGENALSGLDIDTPILDQLKRDRDSSLEQYGKDITDYGYDDIPRVSDEWLEENKSSNPVVNMGFSNYGRSKLPSRFLSEIFDPAVMSGEIQTPFGRGTSKTAMRNRPFVGGKLLFDVDDNNYSEALALNPDTDLL